MQNSKATAKAAMETLGKQPVPVEKEGEGYRLGDSALPMLHAYDALRKIAGEVNHLPSSDDIIRNKKTGRRYRVLSESNGRLKHWRITEVDVNARPAMLMKDAWDSGDWEVVK